MTVSMTDERKERVNKTIGAILLPSMLILMLVHGEGLRRAVTDGALLALSTVLPSVFPFMVFGDAIASIQVRLGRFGSRFGRIFGIPDAAVGAVVCGNVLGFPLGARGISRMLVDDAELSVRCAALATSPSAAFIISGVGAGILRDMRLGLVLYAIMLVSTAITAVIFRGKRDFSSVLCDNTEQNFSLSESITSAGGASITILSSISFFSGMAFIVRETLGNRVALLVSPLLEVSGGVSMLAGAELPTMLRLTLISFALGFSGICAAVQCAPYLPRGGGLRRFLLIKLVVGTVSAMISLPVFYLFY